MTTICYVRYEDITRNDGDVHCPGVCDLPKLAHPYRSDPIVTGIAPASPSRSRSRASYRSRTVSLTRSVVSRSVASLGAAHRTPSFRVQVKARDRRCCVTGFPAVCCDAVHISPICNGSQTGYCDVNDVRNGFMLSSHLHRGYDSLLWTIDESRKVHIR